MLRPDTIQFGRVTSDVITGTSVTQFLAVGHIVMQYRLGVCNEWMAEIFCGLVGYPFLIALKPTETRNKSNDITMNILVIPTFLPILPNFNQIKVLRWNLPYAMLQHT